MKPRYVGLGSIVLIIALVVGCATSQEGQDVKRGTAIGAVGGAAVGLTLGALTGDAGMAAAGAAAGAVAGGAAGGMYMYDQSRDDRRTNTLADAIGGAKAGETADDAGKRHLSDFTGDWNVDIWALDANGQKITAKGKAKAMLTSKDTLTIEYSDIESAGLNQDITGSSVITYSAENGFAIENKFNISPEPRKFVGEYVPDKNAYNFYPTTNVEGKTVTGVIRSNVRIEMRATGTNLAVAETYTIHEGKEVKMQSYRFTRQ